MKKIIIGLLTGWLLVSCNHHKTVDVSNDAEAIMNTDREFSAMSAKDGMTAAFLKYADTAAVLLRAGHFPMKGEDAFDYLQKISDTSFTLTWNPENAGMAISGDLGYTYGIYNYQARDTSFQGTYVSIWQKQADGSWKYILDTGNPGLGTDK